MGYNFDRFVGRIAAIRPASGLFDDQTVEVEVQDWMGYTATQELGIIARDVNKRADQAITTALENAPIQPVRTDFDTGVETFLTIFDTDTPTTSLANFLQKMARNEWGRVYLKADGTLRFENQTHRGGVSALSFELDGLMSEFDVEYDVNALANVVRIRVSLATIDAASILLWSLAGAPPILPGQTLALNCPYTDVNGNQAKISAIDVEDPPFFEFGSVQNFTSDDMHGDLVVVMVIGANSTNVYLTNVHAATTGYLNDLQVEGKGIHFASPLIIERRDEESIWSGIGERPLTVNLEQITDLDTAAARAEALLAVFSNPERLPVHLSFVANQSAVLADASMDLEVSRRFTLAETMTGADGDYFINRVRYILDSTELLVDILASPVD